jgi:histidine triad (HIT) family protein
MTELVSLTQQISQLLMDKLGATGINILSNIGSIASQSVFHFHFHVIPKYKENEGFILSHNSDTSSAVLPLSFIRQQLTAN